MEVEPGGSYRSNARAKCACGAELPAAPLLSPKTGRAVCASCHHVELSDERGLPAAPQGSTGEALRHFAIALTQPKRDALLSRERACTRCKGRMHVVDFDPVGVTIALGTTYLHECVTCKLQLRTETTYATLAKLGGAAMLFGCAWLSWWASGFWGNACALGFAVLGCAVFALCLRRLTNRWYTR